MNIVVGSSGLRCGDSIAANSVIKQFGNINGSSEDSSAVDPSVSDIILQLAQLQQSQETMFGDSAKSNASPPLQRQNIFLSPTHSMTLARRAVLDLYERTKTRPSSSDAESFVVYRAACLALLGGADFLSEATSIASSRLVKTVEDYLYASLWHALHLADSSSDEASTVGSRKMAEAVARLGMLVNQWGPSYFEQDDEGDSAYSSATAAVALSAQGSGVGGARSTPHKVPQSGGWAYALPLLASQQYATALAYLAEAGGGLGLLQSTHVCLVMDAAGLPVSDFNLDNHTASNASQVLLPMLVTSYSASLQGSDVKASLNYIMLLSGKGKLVREQVSTI